MLMRNERLATLRSRYDDASTTLVIDPKAARPRAATCDARGPRRDRAILRRLLRRRAARAAEGAACARASASPTWRARWCRSSTSPRSRRWKTAVGAPVDPLRFRANVYVGGWPAWREFDLLGREIAIGPSAAEDRQAHRALRRDQRRSRQPASAIWRSPTR